MKWLILGLVLRVSTPEPLRGNLTHDRLSPPHGDGNQRFRPRARLGLEKIVGSLQVTRNQNPVKPQYVTVTPPMSRSIRRRSTRRSGSQQHENFR